MSIDHIVSIIIFLAALVLFIGFFGQTLQTATIYQQHQGTATKCSDLLDAMLISPGSPNNWGQSDVSPASFGVQDPEFTQYELSAFSLMRLQTTGDTVVYDKTANPYYTRFSPSPGVVLVTSNAQALNYSEALKLLGVNGTYGFQLSLTPDVNVSVSETHASSPLTLAISANGQSFPFSGATVNYCLVAVTLGQNDAQYPAYIMLNGTTSTNAQGTASVSFSSVTNPNEVYAFIVNAHLDGIVGVGYHVRNSESDQSIVPILQDMGKQTVVLAHSFDLNNSEPQTASLKYNATFVVSTQDYTLSELSLANTPYSYGLVTSGKGNPTENVTLPSCTTGILIVVYQESSSQGGVILMPWGINSLQFQVSFGGNPSQQDWVATDLRQITIGPVSYQAKMSLWSQTHVQVKS